MKGRAPILKLNEALVVLFASSMVFAGTQPTAHASGPEPEKPGPIVLAGTARILGHWQRGEGEAIIEISERDGVFSGVIVWSEKRPETVGIEVFRELRYDADDEMWKGRAYSIKRKREVPIDIEVPGHDELELTAHILIFKRQVDFTRIPTAKIAALRAQRGL